MMTKDLVKVSVLVVLIASVLIFIVWSQEPSENLEGEDNIQGMEEAKEHMVPKVKGIWKEIKRTAEANSEGRSKANANDENQDRRVPVDSPKYRKSTPSNNRSPYYVNNNRKRPGSERWAEVCVDPNKTMAR